MKHYLFSLILVCISSFTFSQSKRFSCEKVYEAVNLIDSGSYDQAIDLLKECEKSDPEEYTYPYEIALALTYKKEYQKAIDKLESIKHYKGSTAEVYQLLGNNYDYLGETEKAISTYNEGLKIFPNAGRLYLEKGVVYEGSKKFKEAINTYESGIKAEPTYSSNYYRVAKLYLKSNDKLSGIIYGELFMNIERASKRTLEMSELVYKSYKNSVRFFGDSIKADFCDIVIDATQFKGKLPFCAVFGKHFMLSLLGENKIDLNSLAEIRSKLIISYAQEDMKQYPNSLFQYLHKLSEAGLLKTYSRYILQMGEPESFTSWQNNHVEDYEKFVDWYSKEENYLKLDQGNIFVSDSIK